MKKRPSIIKKLSIEDSIIFATACAALSIGYMGANNNIPKPAIVKKFIKKKLNTSTKKRNFSKEIPDD